MSTDFTVLVVDDEKHNRQLLTELLQHECRLVLAKNGEQALARASEQQPDLILLDVVMPDMSGHAVIRQLKEDDGTRDIPVIFITALDSFDDQETGLELGAVDYIAKPFHPPIVRARVRNHLRLVEQRRLLEQLAMLDNLTGIPNRRRFVETLAQEWRRCLRHALPLSLIVADIDHFKRINDTYGHAQGDDALRSVAQALKWAVHRPGDFVCRYGGEEFVLLLPGVDADGAFAFADCVRQHIATMPLQTANGKPLQLTLSLGGASHVPTVPDVSDALFLAADRALYDAKHAGRNRVVWAPPRADGPGTRRLAGPGAPAMPR
ncbi:GGDEF domain-containing response regulator [Thauera linaloolentis]|uniref:diguanylate cyclase n=1 Tax=Thauera linaloolentis (strain DSM 12138 / JCM 21573 / CCUG 41526 / CIP 105981 / IAM 15112 / NBRC 102519 / 47Lol) TaxID=1123367 RepID=N6Y172_THAL4|nr:diguanylate cyclase [Thauera linaloolentis]ENO85295.1 two-component response regulator [Thauera linaloolentis 47Lol = DSM 12138]MCM8563982.1 diguanylate cyclase [Thauera linaloolentis]